MATPSSESSKTDSAQPSRREQELHAIQDALRGLRYGSINVIVQDGVVVQIDRTEKQRLHRSTGGES